MVASVGRVPFCVESDVLVEVGRVAKGTQAHLKEDQEGLGEWDGMFVIIHLIINMISIVEMSIA